MFRLDQLNTHRRGFLGTIAAAAAAGLASLTPLRAVAEPAPRGRDPRNAADRPPDDGDRRYGCL